MTATVTAPGAGRGALSSATWVVTGLTLRQTWRGAVVVIALAALMSAVAVGAYRTAVASPSDAAALAALAENPAIRTLFGQPVALHDAGGFAVWRTGTVLSVLLAVRDCLPRHGSPGARRTQAGGTSCSPGGCRSGRW